MSAIEEADRVQTSAKNHRAFNHMAYWAATKGGPSSCIAVADWMVELIKGPFDVKLSSCIEMVLSTLTTSSSSSGWRSR